MELLNNPQIHSTFASLGSMQGDTYVVSDECMSILEEINCKLSMEDHTLRTYRRAIGFGQNIKKDIIPLIINVRDPKIFDCALRLMVNLTVPIECLLSVSVMSRTEIGRHTIYELNRLLHTSKEAFLDLKATKAILDHMTNILENDKMSLNECETINNCLLLLRNILHIPENVQHQQTHTPMQNQILWNLFTQSIDKLLIYLMSCPQKSFWGVTIVQLIALMYKDQHVGTLQKLLNHWFEAASVTESSENESNTSPPKKNSDDSSPMMTSDPTSDSSDNCSGTTKKVSNPLENEESRNSEYQTNSSRAKPKLEQTSAQESIDSANSSMLESSEFSNEQDIDMKSPEPHSPTRLAKTQEWCQKSNNHKHPNTKSCSSNNSKSSPTNQSSEVSDCGYGTQMSQGDIQENRSQQNLSPSSSSDDDIPKQKPAHQKPPSTNKKQRFNAVQKQAKQASITNQDKTDARRKKLVKRGKSSIINMKGMIHHTPSDEDISNILKEFTVDFLLKGYGSLVQDLHEKLLLTDVQLSIDTSHFFWLVTYFLKFAAQLELDMDHINSVLSYDILGYLTFEGVNLCEQLEIMSRQQGANLKPYLRRIHLVVTAIREFLQALDVYKKSTHLSLEDREKILVLETRIGCTEDLRRLFVLLLRCYNPMLQSQQYLQDLVVTNHILLLLLDKQSKQADAKCEIDMNEHVQQFATAEIMSHYGVLLENFRENGEFVNDCIFTMIHHVGGDLDQVAILFQPKILKTFSKLWDSEYKICDDWSDLIEYVIHKFINMPPKPATALLAAVESDNVSMSDVWAQEEMDTLYWYYVQSKKLPDVVGNIIKQIKDSGLKIKSRIAVIQQLLQQDIINLQEFNDLMKFEDSQYEAKFCGESASKKESDDQSKENSKLSPLSVQTDDIKLLRDRLMNENKGALVEWLQNSLLECCHIKMNLAKPKEDQLLFPSMEPVALHCILNKQSIPLVPFNDEQNKILVYQPFVLLLHKLGFHLPADANKLFVRIPEFWTADILFTIAEKLGPIPRKNLKFDLNLVCIKKSLVIPAANDVSMPMFIDDPLFSAPSSSDSDLMCTNETSTSPNWVQLVMQSKSESTVFPPSPELTVNTNSMITFLEPSPLSSRNVSNDLIMIAKSES